MIELRPLIHADIPECAAILRSLPYWFGLEESNAQYMRDLETLPAFVATEAQELGGKIIETPEGTHDKGMNQEKSQRREIIG